MEINSDGLGLQRLKIHKVRFEILGKSLIHKNTTAQSANVFLYFLQKQHVSKNLALELWTKNLKTNQNAGFFKPQYLTKNLSYEVEFLDMIKGPRKH